MAFELKVCKTILTDKGDGIYISGPYVTPAVHDAINAVMSASYITDPAYKARQAVGAFFQGGSQDREGNFVFVECWNTGDKEKVAQFEKVINDAVRRLIPEEMTEIRVAATTSGVYYLFLEIAKETDCRYYGGNFGTPLYFYPENNEQWWKVYNLCKQMELHIGFPIL